MFERCRPLSSAACAALLGFVLSGCSSSAKGSGGSGGEGGLTGSAGTGGETGSGEISNGGTTSGGGAAGALGGGDSTSGGRSSGGSPANGGAGASTGTGGTSNGGMSSGGASNGGMSSGGMSSGGAGGSAGAHAGAWKVMMLGDSITAATCYPQLVSKNFVSGGHTNFQFIGTQMNQQSCSATEVREEGHSGYGVTYLPENSKRAACQKPACGSYAELQSWAAEKPEIVLMHYGTNDVWDGQAASDILSAYVSVIAEFRKQDPNVVFFVSKIIKLNPSGCTGCLANVASLAAALTGSWATTNSTTSSPVFIVDDYDSAFDPNSENDTTDGVHPTPAGAQIVADVTASAVIAKGYF